MTDNRKTTVPGASVGADAVQSSDKITTNIITNSGKQINLQAAKKSNNFGLNTVSMTELYDTVYPPRKPIVNDLLYSGTYLFVGAPKVGKSFFMGQLAYHVAMGLPLWEYEVHQGTVLYLALEDDYARLQRRLSRMFGVEETNNLYFATQAKSVSEGLDQQLEGFIREHPDVRLIIIDTLQKVREIGGDRYSYASDYEIVTKLKTFSDRYGIRPLSTISKSTTCSALQERRFLQSTQEVPLIHAISLRRRRSATNCTPTPSWMPSTTRMCCRSVWTTSRRWTQSRTWTINRFGTLTAKRRSWHPSAFRW